MPISRLENFHRWDFYCPIELKLKVVDASQTPFITYENGVPCYEANMYMLKQLVAQRSRRVNGGTLRTYANSIIHLIRFIERQPFITRFSQLTDVTFTLFVQGLQAQKNKQGKRVRSNNRVIEIAHRCLDFLNFIKDMHDLENFIGLDKKNAIRLKITKHSMSIEGSRSKRQTEELTHVCVPTKEAIRRKLPVSEQDALRVWEFIQNQDNRSKRLRDIALYQCMEQLGARVTELHLMMVKDVEQACAMTGNAHICLTTLKRRGGSLTRHIPISRALLRDIRQYMNVRKRVIKKCNVDDHGYLFISLTTGSPFHAQSWSTYMNRWKKELGIEAEIHPHLYRHAFITEKLKDIILQHKKVNSADKFREQLLHTAKFKMQLQQWTGHTNIQSLDTYIHLALADVHGYPETYYSVKLKDAVTIVRRQTKSIKQQLKEKQVTVNEALVMIDDVLKNFDNDIEGSKVSFKE